MVCSRCAGEESASCSLGGACSPAREPRTGAGGLCLPAAGRWQAQIDPRWYSEKELTARPAYLCCSFRGG